MSSSSLDGKGGGLGLNEGRGFFRPPTLVARDDINKSDRGCVRYLVDLGERGGRRSDGGLDFCRKGANSKVFALDLSIFHSPLFTL